MGHGSVIIGEWRQSRNQTGRRLDFTLEFDKAREFACTITPGEPVSCLIRCTVLVPTPRPPGRPSVTPWALTRSGRASHVIGLADMG
jgi:hypothetical protein